MDDNTRNNGAEKDKQLDPPKQRNRTPEKSKRRSPSAPARTDRSVSRGRRRSRSASRSKSKSRSRSRSRSKARDLRRGSRRRRSRSRSRAYSPDRRRGGRFRGRGFNRDFHNNRRQRSPSPRGRNVRGGFRRSRSASFDRYRRRSGSRENSQNRRTWKKGPMSPPSPSSSAHSQQRTNNANYGMPPHSYPEQGVYNTNYQPGYAPVPNQAYPNYEYNAGPYPMYSTLAPPETGEFSAQPWNGTENSALAPPKPVGLISSSETDEEKQKRDAAVEQEKKNQQQTLRKQRDSYKKRAIALKRELKTLKNHREELVSGGDPPSPTTRSFLKDNEELQTQIEHKISTIENVIDMLTGIIGDDRSASPTPERETTKRPEAGSSKSESSPEHLKTKVIESLKKRKTSERSGDEKMESEYVNYTFFDPETHWCKPCSEFPKTAKEYLAHLQGDFHKKSIKQPETPWHEAQVVDDFPSHSNAPTKRVPIRGLQFFVPMSGWYCKMCDVWMGDLHCASSHLKSQTHSNKYTQFIKKNPNFESDWMNERENSRKSIAEAPSPPMIRYNEDELAAMKKRFDEIPILQQLKIDKDEKDDKAKKGKKKKKEKKKRKKSKKKRRHSSSSSSSSSSESESDSESNNRSSAENPVEPVVSATSIRVAMRNAVPPAPNEPPREATVEEVGGKWTVIQEAAQPLVPRPPTISENGEAENRRDEIMLSQWNATEPVINDKEKQLLDQLKERLKNRDVDKKIVEEPTKPEKRTRERSESRERDRNRDRDRDRDRRRSRSRSPRRRRSRSPRRDYRRRSRSPASRSRRSRSTSHSRRWSRNRRSRSRSRSRSHRIEKAIVTTSVEFKPRVPEPVKKRNEKENGDKKVNKSSIKTDSKKTTIPTGKKLPFIGRMPLFKKLTSAEEEAKKNENNGSQVSEEERLAQERRTQEFKFQIQQKQQLIQQQQKAAEAYNLAHPGTFDAVYSSHGSIQHILPPVAEYYEELMPDPMQYATMMMGAAVPPPPPAAVENVEPTPVIDTEPVLPPGIDEEEAQSMDTTVAVPPPAAKVGLPQDFQEALSIIFDKDKSQSIENDVVDTVATEVPDVEMQIESDSNTMNATDAAVAAVYNDESNTNLTASSMELDEQSQYLLYGSMSDKPLIFNETTMPILKPKTINNTTSIDYETLPENIPTPPIKVLDANGQLMQLPSENDLNAQNNEKQNKIDDEAKRRRMQELEELAMLGIDVSDLAAQCI